MSYSLFDSFTIDEAYNVGQKFKVKCIGSRGYESDLTTGKVYEIEITPCILPLSPLCKFTGDTGKQCEGHLHRFKKLTI